MVSRSTSHRKLSTSFLRNYTMNSIRTSFGSSVGKSYTNYLKNSSAIPTRKSYIQNSSWIFSKVFTDSFRHFSSITLLGKMWKLRLNETRKRLFNIEDIKKYYLIITNVSIIFGSSWVYRDCRARSEICLHGLL